MSLELALACPSEAKCPNCWEDIIEAGYCECWLWYDWSIDIWNTLNEKEEDGFKLNKTTDKVEEEVKEEVNETMKLKSKRFIFRSWNYSSYSINIQKNGKVWAIRFKFWKEKFIIHLIDYYLDEVEDVNPYSGWAILLRIKNLKIWPIAKKVRNWYSEYKNSINLFRWFWLDYKNCKNFIESLLENYHLSNN